MGVEKWKQKKLEQERNLHLASSYKLCRSAAVFFLSLGGFLLVGEINTSVFLLLNTHFCCSFPSMLLHLFEITRKTVETCISSLHS